MFNNNAQYKWCKHSSWKIEVVRLYEKARSQSILSVRDLCYLKYKDINKVHRKELENIYNANAYWKKTGLTILLSDKASILSGMLLW